jgi:hypothetical protein
MSEAARSTRAPFRQWIQASESSVHEAVALLLQAKGNGGGLELHNVFGPAAENMVTVEQIMAAVQAHEALQWCLQEPAMLKMQRDDSLVPPVAFVLTGAGETFTDLWEDAGQAGLS